MLGGYKRNKYIYFHVVAPLDRALIVRIRPLAAYSSEKYTLISMYFRKEAIQ